MENKYAYLMVDYDTPQFIKDIHSQIKDEELFKDGADSGLELQTHVTIAPCIENNTPLDALKKHLLPLKYYTILLNNISSFNNDLFDVLKCDVQCDFLHQTNSNIIKTFPTFSEYKEYHPHLTIAYLNKGVCQRFENNILTPLVILKPKCFNYSFYDENGEMKNIRFI